MRSEPSRAARYSNNSRLDSSPQCKSSSNKTTGASVLSREKKSSKPLNSCRRR